MSLGRAECRILHQPKIQDALLHDLDTCEATTFLETTGYFDEDQVQTIINRTSRLERYREFLRAYKRKCSSFLPLCEYLDYIGQRHLKDIFKHCSRSESLNMNQSYEEARLANDMTGKMIRRKLLLGNVPTSRHLIPRNITLKLAETLREISKLDGFIVAVHGCAGAGKTSVVAQCLENNPDLLMQHYDAVIWVPDCGETKRSLQAFQRDLLLLLKSDLDFSCEKELSPRAVKEMVIDALLDWPNLLIVVDEVINEESLLWLDTLNCRIVITTRDVDFLQASTLPLRKIEITLMNTDEISSYLEFKGLSSNLCEEMQEASEGIPALICQLITLSGGEETKIRHFSNLLKNDGVNSIRCRSLYRHESMADTLRQSLRNTPESLQDPLIWTGFMPSSVGIPLEVWTEILPVDVLPNSSIPQAVEIVLIRLTNLSWIFKETKSADHSFRTLKVFSAFLRSQIEPEHRMKAGEIIKDRLQMLKDKQDTSFILKNAQIFQATVNIC